MKIFFAKTTMKNKKTITKKIKNKEITSNTMKNVKSHFVARKIKPENLLWLSYLYNINNSPIKEHDIKKLNKNENIG